jgi:hypothetical protein
MSRGCGKLSRILRVILLSTSVVFMTMGILRGEIKEVFYKAINICLECIGIG